MAWVWGCIGAPVLRAATPQQTSTDSVRSASVTAITTDITVNPGYSVMGLGVSVKAHDALTVFLRVDNLADTEWDSALGYPGLPRAAVVGARFDIGRR